MWDLSSPARDQSCALQWKHRVLTPGPAGDVLKELTFQWGSFLVCPSALLLPGVAVGVCRAGAAEVPQPAPAPPGGQPEGHRDSRHHGAGMAGMAHGSSRRHFPSRIPLAPRVRGPREPSAASVSSPRCQGCCLRCLWGWTPSATSVHGAWLSGFPEVSVDAALRGCSLYTGDNDLKHHSALLP